MYLSVNRSSWYSMNGRGTLIRRKSTGFCWLILAMGPIAWSIVKAFQWNCIIDPLQHLCCKFILKEDKPKPDTRMPIADLGIVEGAYQLVALGLMEARLPGSHTELEVREVRHKLPRVYVLAP